MKYLFRANEEVFNIVTLIAWATLLLVALAFTGSFAHASTLTVSYTSDPTQPINDTINPPAEPVGFEAHVRFDIKYERTAMVMIGMNGLDGSVQFGHKFSALCFAGSAGVNVINSQSTLIQVCPLLPIVIETLVVEGHGIAVINENSAPNTMNHLRNGTAQLPISLSPNVPTFKAYNASVELLSGVRAIKVTVE